MGTKLTASEIAKKFYSDVFEWSFTRTKTMDGKALDENEIAMFEVPGQGCPGGGITRVCKDQWNQAEGRKGVVLYLYVEDIETWEKVSTSSVILG